MPIEPENAQENAQESTATAVRQEAEAKPEERLFTQAEVDALAAKARASGRKSALKSVSQPAKESPKQPSGNPDFQEIKELILAQSEKIEAQENRIEALVSSNNESMYEKAIGHKSLSESDSIVAKSLFNTDRDAFDVFMSGIGEPKEQEGSFTGLGAPKSSNSQTIDKDPSKWTSDDVRAMGDDRAVIDNIEGKKKTGFGY